MELYLTLKEILKITRGTPSRNFDPQTLIKQFVIDSRQAAPNTLFVPLKGEKTDGHLYIKNALENKAAAYFTQDKKYFKYPNGILVKNTLNALARIAKYKRKFAKKVIGLTGSYGKTTTKELMRLVFSHISPDTYANQGNFNNEIGLPLTLANMDKAYDYVILEMGTSSKGEISNLVKIASPDVRILLTITTAHTQYLKTFTNVINAKAEIFDKGDNIVIFYPLTKYYPYLKRKNVITYGYTQEADIAIADVKLGSRGYTGTLHFSPRIKKLNFLKPEIRNMVANKKITITIPIFNKRIFENLSAVAGTILLIGQNPLDYLKAAEKFKGYSGRGIISQVIFANKKITIIDNTYNSNPGSLKNLFDSTKDLKGIKIYVIGDMLELGKYEKRAHENIIHMAPVNQKNTYLYLFGNLTRYAYTKAKTKTHVKYFDINNKQKLIEDLKQLLHSLPQGQALYIIAQGSRGMRLEEVLYAIGYSNENKR